MEKATTLNLRVNPEVKKEAEEVLDKLGLSMTAAINIYLKQIALQQGIPFIVKLPVAPYSVNADAMTDEELHQKLIRGYSEINQDKLYRVAEVMEK